MSGNEERTRRDEGLYRPYGIMHDHLDFLILHRAAQIRRLGGGIIIVFGGIEISRALFSSTQQAGGTGAHLFCALGSDSGTYFMKVVWLSFFD